jgi:hypothetical protein
MLESLLIPLAQTPESMGAVAFAADIAQLVIAAAILVLAGLAALLFWRTSALLRELHGAARANLAPVSDRAGRISDNVEYITQTLRTDVETLNASVRSLSDRLQLASERMEERIEEFNALMEVVQGEAEAMFIDTASTVRGVREGARAMTERTAARSGMLEAPSEEVDAAHDLDAAAEGHGGAGPETEDEARVAEG